MLSRTGSRGNFEFSAGTGAHTVDFVFLHSGSIAQREGDGWTESRAELLVVSSEHSCSVRLLDEWRFTAVRVPLDALETFLPRPLEPFSAFTQCSALERAMRAFATSLILQHRAGQATPSAIESYALEQLLVEMSGAALLDRLGAGAKRGTPQAMLRDRAIAVIVQQSTDPDLTPRLVARETQSSLRQLQAVFAEIGTTVSTQIRKRRAQLAYTHLQDDRFDVLSIMQIADRSGFGTTMSMRRALAEFYGKCPRDIRDERSSADLAPAP